MLEIRRRAGLLLGLALVGVLVGYATSLPIGFEFDDTYLIRSNPWIQHLTNIPRFFWDPATLQPAIPANHDLRGPLVTTYAINYAISGLEPWSYHVAGILIHLAVAGLVFLVVKDFLGNPHGETLGAVAALFFAIAPLNGQPIIYQSSRSASLMTLFYLGAFYCYLRDWPKRGVLFQSLALLTKAVAVTLPATLLFYVLLYRKRSPRMAVAFVLSLIVDALYLMYRALLVPVLPDMPNTSRWSWVLSQPPTLLTYARRFVWPYDLSIDHQNVWPTLYDPQVWLGIAVILAALAIGWMVRRSVPSITFGIGWFFLTLVPEASVIPLGEVANDHRPYIASVGLAVILAWLLLASTRRRAVVPICVTLALLSVGFNWNRNYIWRDSVRLWQHTAMTNPGNGRAWMNAGVGLMARGRYPEARAYFEEAQRRAPNYSFVYENLSILDKAEGKLESSAVNATRARALGYGR